MSITAPTLAGDTIYQGAAHIIFDKTGAQSAWKYLFAEGDVTIDLKRPEADVNVAGFGVVGNRVMDELVEVTFTPSSHVDADILTFLYGSILAAMPGASYFGATDTPVYIHTMAGRLMALTNAKVTGFPAINFGIAPKRFEGQVTITGILGRGLARTASNALFTPWAAQAFSATPLEGDYAVGPVSAIWSQTAPLTIEGMEAWKLTPQVRLVPQQVANLGTINYRVQDVTLEASCVPANLLETNLWADYVIGATRSLGSSVAGVDLTLAEDTPGLVAVVKNARLVQAPTRFDVANPIAGQCLWRSRRKVVTNVWTPAGTLAMAS